MDTPPPEDVPPPMPPIVLPAADLPPLGDAEMTPVTVLQPAVRRVSRRAMYLMVGAPLILVSIIVLGYFEPEAWVFLLLAAVIPPMAVLPMLAYAGERSAVARALAFAAWLGLVGAAATYSLSTVMDEATSDSARIVFAAIVSALGVILGLLCFLPKVRAAAARHIPIDPNSFVHAVALGTAVALTIIFFVPVLALGGPPALDQETLQKNVDQLQQFPPAFILRMLCYAYFWLIIGELCFVGFPIVRSARGALRRLGLVRPTIAQVAFAVVAAVALIFVVDGWEWVIARLWEWSHWPRTDEKAFNQLMGFAISPIGAVVLGVSAGLSEEIAIRGVLQPRLGIILSNLLFTSAHAFQYNLDGLLSVFLIGLVLALIRRRFNTTTSAITHGTFDCLVILETYWAMNHG